MTRVSPLLAVAMSCAAALVAGVEVDPAVARIERDRIEVIQRLSRSTVAIFERSGGNGGSGVIVRPDGLVVTNFHVTQPCGPKMLCATSDGRLHDAVLLGLDPTGDIALVQLQGDGPFPAAEWGDSDRVRVGDPAIVAGNPFLLAEDFTPSISVGVISGVRRYQGPSGSLLEYADCLQTDAAINPGNSGGPLFDGRGRLIGINGRGSFEKRGRVNVGFGYAVSINQVRRFLTHLEAGRLVDHASLGATVVTRSGPQAIVNAIETTSDAYRRGLRPGDEIVSLDGRDTPTANALLNAVGVLPAGWRSRLEFRRGGRLYARDVRLGSLHASGELEAAVADPSQEDGDEPEIDERLYRQREGYANYVANRRATDRLLAWFGDAVAPAGTESVEHDYFDAVADEPVRLRVERDGAAWLAKSGEYRLDADATSPRKLRRRRPALLGALWAWRRLADGEASELDTVEARGKLPWQALGEPHDVLAITHRGLSMEVYFDPETGQPRGIEATRDAGEDSVRVDLQPESAANATLRGSGISRLNVTVGDRRFANLRLATDAEGPGQ